MENYTTYLKMNGSPVQNFKKKLIILELNRLSHFIEHNMDQLWNIFMTEKAIKL